MKNVPSAIFLLVDIFDGSGGGDLITRQTYGDFDLQVEWKVANGANSGIMWRVSLGDSAPYMSGPEYQILDDSEHADGANELTAAGSLYGMFPAKDRDGNKTLRDVGTWNKTRITVVGNRVTYYLNLKKVLETEIGSPEWNEQLGRWLIDGKVPEAEKPANPPPPKPAEARPPPAASSLNVQRRGPQRGVHSRYATVGWLGQGSGSAAPANGGAARPVPRSAPVGNGFYTGAAARRQTPGGMPPVQRGPGAPGAPRFGQQPY